MLGFLLARAGIDVTVLEKHKDFFRDFRGDTVHPSTLELMYELGLLDEFLKVPHDEVSRLAFQVGAERIPMVDFSHLPTHCKFVALMPQWDFLNFLAERAKRYPSFHLLMEADATDLISERDRVIGLRAKTPDGDIEIHARWWSAATAATPPCASAPALRSRTSARRSTCCGSGCRGGAAIPRRRVATSRPAR